VDDEQLLAVTMVATDPFLDRAGDVGRWPSLVLSTLTGKDHRVPY